MPTNYDDAYLSVMLSGHPALLEKTPTETGGLVSVSSPISSLHPDRAVAIDRATNDCLDQLTEILGMRAHASFAISVGFLAVTVHAIAR